MQSSSIPCELALTAERERELIGRAQCGCQRARNRLLLEAIRPVYALVAATYPRARDRDDLAHEALLALPDAIARYDLAHPAQVRLLTFARKALLGAMSRYWRWRPLREDAARDAAEEGDDEERSVIEWLDAPRLRAALGPMVGGLDPLARDIVLHRIMADEPHPLRVIAARHRVSTPWVHAVERRTLNRLRNEIRAAAPDLLVR
jgi:RNA polymerase sigma factor (sigma-70 family)